MTHIGSAGQYWGRW